MSKQHLQGASRQIRCVNLRRKSNPRLAPWFQWIDGIDIASKFKTMEAGKQLNRKKDRIIWNIQVEVERSRFDATTCEALDTTRHP